MSADFAVLTAKIYTLKLASKDLSYRGTSLLMVWFQNPKMVQFSGIYRSQVKLCYERNSFAFSVIR